MQKMRWEAYNELLAEKVEAEMSSARMQWIDFY